MQQKESHKIHGNKYFFLSIFFLFLFFPFIVFASTDSDGDGISDEKEILYGTHIFTADTDGDGFSDLEEIKNGFSPLAKDQEKSPVVDTDGDGLYDFLEIWFGTRVDTQDSDADGFADYDEVMFGFSPTSSLPTKLSRKVEVNLTRQEMSYMVEGMGVHVFPVSTGNPVTPTPVGEFSIQRRVPVMRYTGRGYDYPGVKWNMQFFPRYYLHTAYWHNDFGKRTRSHGCVNMREKDAAILYKYSEVGMQVSIIGKTPKNLFVAKN